MNIASLELSKQLYELSGWADTSHEYYHSEYPNRMDVAGVRECDADVLSICPAYDLGYLLRKLPGVQLNRQSDEEANYGNTAWACESGNYAKIADTPEDAAAKLAIELFKQGILTKDAT
jgi:hypothetical protein